MSSLIYFASRNFPGGEIDLWDAVWSIATRKFDIFVWLELGVATSIVSTLSVTKTAGLIQILRAFGYCFGNE